MMRIDRLLTPREDDRSLTILLWWEKRRFAYNAVLFVGGILGLALLTIAMELSSHGNGTDEGLEPLAGIILFAVGANIVYTVGWLSEVFLCVVGCEKRRGFAPYAWSRGLLFMLALCFAPGVAHFMIWLVSAITDG